MRKSRHINIPVFVPHKGCPHTCVFCDQRKISGTQQALKPQEIIDLIKDSLSTAEPDDFVEIAFFGGSFTGIPENEMLDYLEATKPFFDEKKVHGIRLSTRPDYINPNIIDLLKQYGVTTIELGVQSLNDEVLKLSRRGHTAQEVGKACELIKKSGIKLGIQIMPGLPGDTFEIVMKTVQGVLALKPDMVRIYPVIVVEGTELERLYKSGKYEPLSMKEAIEWSAAALLLFRDENITVLRIGLHSTDTLGSSVIAGPYHPAFGELVESHILFGEIVGQLDRMELSGDEELLVRVRPELLSKFIGQKRSNINAIKGKYKLKDINIIEDPNVESFEIEIPIRGEVNEDN